MSKNCIYLKQKIDKTLHCKLNKKRIKISDCFNCKFKEYNKRKRNKESVKLERNRFSILYKDLTKCAECGISCGIEKNEVFEGVKRKTSMKNGFIVPLCKVCHMRFHSEREFALKYKKMFQREYEKAHSREKFLNLIHRNYL